MGSRPLPKDPSKSFTVNGIKYANRKEYEERYKKDLQQFAELLYDIYQEQKLKDTDRRTIRIERHKIT